MVVAMASRVRYPISIAIVLLAVAATAGVFVFARPEYRPSSGVSITLPAKQPANARSMATPQRTILLLLMAMKPPQAIVNTGHTGMVRPGDSPAGSDIFVPFGCQPARKR